MARWYDRKGREQKAREELFSAYLDDQLSAEERARLEDRLAADPNLQAELAALRQTVAMVRELPEVALPRKLHSFLASQRPSLQL